MTLGVAALLCSDAVLADDLGPVFRMIGVAEGLPDSRIEAVVQDENGYIWIGTQGGLVRHQGNTLHVIGADPEQPDPLPGRNIMALHAHSDGTVWAAVSGQGLVQIGPDLRQKRHLQPADEGGPLPHDNIWSLAEDCDGNLWIAYMQGGVGRYQPDTGQYRHYDQDEHSGLHPSGFQINLAVDSQCRIWLAQSEQLGVIEPDRSDRFEKVLDRGSGPILFEIGEALGEIYYTQGEMLFTLGPVDEALDAEPRRLLSEGRVLTGFATEPGTGRLMVTSYEGLFRLHPPSGRYEQIQAHPGLADGLPNANLLGILYDDEGGGWIMVPRHGVAYVAPGYGAFERYQPIPGSEQGLKVDVVSAITYLADEEELWLGSIEQGVEVLDLATGESVWLHERLDAELSTNPYADLLVDGNRAFLAQLSAVSMIDRDTGEGRVLLGREQVEEGTFHMLELDGPDHLWIGNRGQGLIRLDLQTRELERYSPQRSNRYHFPETDVVMHRRGPDDHWWTAGTQGVYRLERGQGYERMIELERPPLLAATWEGEDLWLASEVDLQHWRWRSGALELFEIHRLPGRLPPGRIHHIFPVAGGGVWLVRSSGLARLDPETGRFRSYTRDDGLASSEFLKGSAIRLADGRLAAGGGRGLVVLDPWQVGGAESAPPVHITGLQAGAERFRLSPGSHSAIELDHDNNSFFVDFAALSYVSFEQNRYRVMLEGWDDSWLEFVGQTRHHYSNLPPGEYRFRVQAANADGLWNETGDTLALRIHKPPWLSNWALAGYALLGLTGAGLGWRGFRATRRRRLEMREARHKRALAEAQRQVVERLNRSLEPLDLAATIAAEIVAVTGASRACIGFEHEQLPRTLVCTDESGAVPDREQWRAGLERADGQAALAVSLGAENEMLARVLVEAGRDGFAGDYRQGLDLLVEMAGQALYNSLLLERVRSLAERAEQASSAKSEFLATMSHEIRTPLHGVLGMVELLYETETEPSQQDILNTLRHSGLQLQRIIDDVLDISRIEAGRLSLDEQPFELVATLEQVVDLHAPNAAIKGLDLRLCIASDLPPMAVGDPDRIAQVLGNLLSNAVKFSEQGGVEVVAEVGGDDRLVLIVSDSGPGIDQADRERLFEPFTQLDASITRSHSGSGLGLAICRRLVDAMAGELQLLDTCHRGSRFAVRLPVLERQKQSSCVPHTRLLDGVVVAAVLAPADYRVARRLARRWNIRLINAALAAPAPATLLLLDPLSLERYPELDLERWSTGAGAVASLQSPYGRVRHGMKEISQDTHFLRWPLVESRLIGLLLDLGIRQEIPQAR